MAPPCRLGTIRFRFVVISLTSLLACSPQASDPLPSNHLPSRDSGVELTPTRLNLGKLLPGRKAAGKVLIRNRGTEMILATRFDTSCPCVRATVEHKEIGPGETVTLTIDFDPAEEPDFRGSLSVEYIGRSPSDHVLLTGHVDVAVESVQVAGTDSPEHVRGEQPQEPQR